MAKIPPIWQDRKYIQNYITANKIEKTMFYKNAWLVFHVMKLYENYIHENFDITFEEFWKSEEQQYKFYEYEDI